MAAVEMFEKGLLEWCGLVLQRAKKKGRGLEGEFVPGFICYGLPLGSFEYVRQMLGEKGDDEVVMKAVKLFRGSKCFGRSMPSDTKWDVLISSGTRLGLEYMGVWEALKQDAEWVGEELVGGASSVTKNGS